MSIETLPPEETRSAKGTKRVWLVFSATVVAVIVAVSYALLRPESVVVAEEPRQTISATPTELANVAKMRIFFGHQSVGQNIIDSIPTIYSQANIDVPQIVESSAPRGATGGYIEHAQIGTNGDPVGKVAEFERIMRGGVADNVDVAAMKFCYIDFNSTTDVDKVFDSYRDAMARLQRDYPGVTLLYLTVPVTTERSVVTRVKDRLGLSEFNSPSDNVIREQFNERVRAEYGDTGRLFDIAAAQATSNGSMTIRSVDGANYYAMEDGLASDLGHLNAEGAVVIGNAFVASIAQAKASAAN